MAETLSARNTLVKHSRPPNVKRGALSFIVGWDFPASSGRGRLLAVVRGIVPSEPIIGRRGNLVFTLFMHPSSSRHS